MSASSVYICAYARRRLFGLMDSRMDSDTTGGGALLIPMNLDDGHAEEEQRRYEENKAKEIRALSESSGSWS